MSRRISQEELAAAAHLGVTLKPGDAPLAIAALCRELVRLQGRVAELEGARRATDAPRGLLRRLRGGA